MKKAIFTLLSVSFLAATAQAGSSATTLACSSESGRTVISGILPGQGEIQTDLNFSVASDMIRYQSEDQYSPADATVDLNAKKGTVLIEVKQDRHVLVIKSADAARTKLTQTRNGTKGSFIGLVSGTHPSNWEKIPTAIEVRCYVTDEI